MNGLDICYAVRQRYPLLPIIMVTALDSEADRVMGLSQGSDDYLVKPFSIRELKARVQSQLRRLQAMAAVSAGSPPRVLSSNGLVLDLDARSCHLDRRQVELTAREFDLLCHFMSHPGRAFSRAQLLDAVWGYNYEGYEHTVNSHINRLRMKLETNPGKPRLILTVWGLGYKFAPAETAAGTKK
jgi:DNA-binding response OmpR family regulator